jgi:seryl-tRNA synthetase
MGNNKNLKLPKELFEEKRLHTLAKLNSQNTEEVEESTDRKILPPKDFFGGNIVDQTSQENIRNIDEKIENDVIEVDPYEHQIVELKTKLFEIESSIPEEVDLTEILEFVNTIKDRIDNIPKPKDYSGEIKTIYSELNRIENNIPIPEVFDSSDLYYNVSILKDKIEEVRSKIPTIPEPILYDDQLDELKEIVENVRNSIPTVPEIKYYDDELQSIIELIEQVRGEIPELPEIKYYDNEITEIENRLLEIQNSIPVVPEVKYYDEDVKNIHTKIDDLDSKINQVNESIPVVPEVKYYDEDVKNINTRIEETVKDLDLKITEIKDSIPTVPEVKYYDEDVSYLNEEIKELYNKISLIKVPDEKVYYERVKNLHSSFEDKNSKLLKKINYLEEIFETFNEKTILQEGLLNEPPKVKNSDPLTPLDQNFVTLDQLQKHYRLFINRVQQQLATIGGGGETRLEFLDDVDRDSAKQNGYILQYNSSVGKFIGINYVPGGGGGGGDYANVAGIATYAITAGIATYSEYSGISTYATSSGIATYASTAGVATALQNIRTFQITGDIIASPITFDGTGNVSLAATIQPNSVALGGDTSGDYVQSITGTSNQIDVSATSGEGSTPTLSIPNQFTIPQDATVIRDFQVNRNLNVNGNITLGGTTAFINVQQLKVSDADIILGIRTDAFGNDVSNDTTANHGGIAVASTEGSPLVNINIVGIETLPPTYKKIMWFKSGAFAGLGTDAWLINYAVGIGSTQFPSGTRLAAGSVQFTEQDLAVIRNINASGVVTATTFIGNLTGTATTANYALIAGVSTSVIGGIGSVTSLSVSGVTTTGTLNVGVGGTIITTTVIGSVGIGTTLPTSKLSVVGDVNVTGVVTATSFFGKVRENVVSVNTNYSVQLSDSVILSTQTNIITMPSAVGLLGDKYYIKNVGVGTVTIKPSGSELIDDYSEMILSEKNSSLILISDNSKWTIF